MVLRTFIAVHCTYIHYRLKKKREGRYKMDGMRGGRRKGTIGMGVRGKKVRYKMDGMRGEKERYNRDGSEREEGKVREGCE